VRTGPEVELQRGALGSVRQVKTPELLIAAKPT
jgi:hypothetical protein